MADIFGEDEFFKYLRGKPAQPHEKAESLALEWARLAHRMKELGW